MLRMNHIDHGEAFDWGRASEAYAKYRDIYPPAFYQRILELGLCLEGQQALDLGTGTGVLPRNLARYGARWTGVDLSDNQIAEAKRLAAEQGLDIRFFAAPAEQTGLPDGAFDVVTACQCWTYFDQTKVLPEITRLLKPQGRFLILFMAWLPFESEIALQSERLVQQYNPNWTGGGIRRSQTQPPAWAEKWFDCLHCEDHALDVAFTRESWHGRMFACRGVGASGLPEEQIAAFARAHWAYMPSVPETFVIPHYVTLLDFRKKDTARAPAHDDRP